ncbi:MAG TPA: hypothetical protein GXZ58_03795 [Bacilli bacterium]|nr:hypothetical protein [Bacilli bacterium]
MLVFIILLVAAAIIFKVADTQLNKNNDKVLSSDARTLDKQRSMQTSKPGKLMRLLKATGLLITAEVLFIHAYLFL